MVVRFPKTRRPALAPLAAPTEAQIALAVAFLDRALAIVEAST